MTLKLDAFICKGYVALVTECLVAANCKTSGP